MYGVQTARTELTPPARLHLTFPASLKSLADKHGVQLEVLKPPLSALRILRVTGPYSATRSFEVAVQSLIEVCFVFRREPPANFRLMLRHVPSTAPQEHRH